MNDEEFGWLVARLETRAANAPSLFRIEVLAISMAAYAALFLNLLFIGVVLYWTFVYARGHGVNGLVISFALLGLMTLPILYVTVRTLLMRVPAPAGRAITREEAPVLFDALDKMRAKLKGPRIHHVLVDGDYNACIAQRPRWGLVGPSVNYLVLGLPFMFGQSTSEMLGVVAHEYGHLCGAHGRVGVWMSRQRLLLHAVHERVDSAAESSFWYAQMAKALDVFMPYFNAYVFVLTRQHEYEADRAAVRMTGAPAVASSLIRSSLLGDWYGEHFWRTLYRLADTRASPAILPYKSMGTAFRMSHDEWATEGGLKSAWRRESDVADTHPCLRARVEALGQQPALPAPLQRTAAAALLGPFSDRLAEEFDQEWWRGQAQSWGKRYRHVTRSQSRLRELEAVPLASLPVHHLQEMAMLKAEFATSQATKPVLEHLLRQPGGPFPMASYVYGRILLEEQCRDGLDYLAQAARHDKRLADSAIGIGFTYLLERDGELRAQKWAHAASNAQPA